ncbi:MAG TPA: hypothetical protein VGM64_21865 [Lacunisphaera sp.]|jgi:PAS domain-containing protein
MSRTPASNVVHLNGSAAFRSLANAFAHLHDFERFVAGLRSALDQSQLFGRTTIAMDRALIDGNAHFSPGTITFPLSDGDEMHGSMQVQPPAKRGQFSAEDLHLMAGLADFLSVVLTQSLRVQDADNRSELLRFMLNQSPVGIAAFGPDRRLMVANDLAIRWLGGEPALPFEDFAEGHGGFHLRASGKLIYGEGRRLSEKTAGGWLAVLHDMTLEQVRLLEIMQKETYRMLAQGGRLGFALIQSGHLRDGVLRQFGALRASLLPGEVAGPYDAHRIGIVFPGLSGLSLRARLRKLRSVFAETSSLCLGYAELGVDGNSTPESVLTAALQRHGPYDEALRPVLLVHDDSAAVADTFAMVLGREFQVIKSTSPTRTRELLCTKTFEGFVTELELRNGVSGTELVRYAREKQPGIRPFLTTVQRAPYGLPSGANDADVLILEKPFNVVTLTQTVRANLPA